MYSVKFLRVALVASAAVLCALPASAGAYKVLHSFTGLPSDGEQPYAELVADSAGRLYGTTFEGGAHGGGSVFRLTKQGKNWTEETLFSFPGGAGPQGGVLIGPSGELYGTTRTGGTFISGTVWRLDPNGSTWTLTTLHEFNPTNQDGYYPSAGLVFGKDGLLYGTTTGQPPQDGQGSNVSPMYGTVFSISPNGDATEYALLHVFGGTNDGQFPTWGRLIADRKGVLTGTAVQGGKFSNGILFQLKPPQKGQTAWTETVLHDFGQGLLDAIGPFTGVTRGLDGSFYGCAEWGHNGLGAIYAVSPSVGESVLYSFGDQPNDPSTNSSCALTVDAKGTIYGTSTGGGSNAKGTVFRLDPPAIGGAWTETVLHSFGPGDGQQPLAAPLKVGKMLYGTTTGGGDGGKGTVYLLKP